MQLIQSVKWPRSLFPVRKCAQIDAYSCNLHLISILSFRSTTPPLLDGIPQTSSS